MGSKVLCVPSKERASSLLWKSMCVSERSHRVETLGFAPYLVCVGHLAAVLAPETTEDHKSLVKLAATRSITPLQENSPSCRH